MEIFINHLEKPQILFSLETIISNDISYNEGTSSEKFVIDNISFSVGLCEDLWDESNVEAVSKCCADVVLWPVYLDYSISKWNEAEKREYALHAKRFGKIVLLINSISDGECIAKGTSAFFRAE
jgi:predicted amidohydrolase